MLPSRAANDPFGVLSAFTARPGRFTPGEVNFLVAVANVLSGGRERQRKEEFARHAALHDPLTGLSNRTLALDRIDRALARRRRDGTGVAVLVLDLDRFKIINDSLATRPAIRSWLLCASRLEETVRQNDTIARLGGGRVRRCVRASRRVRHVIELAERILAAFRQPLLSASGEHVLTASIGIAVAEGADDTAASLLRDADAAMHRAKNVGPGRYELFDATVRAQASQGFTPRPSYARRSSAGSCSVHYQPIVDTASGRPSRWRRSSVGSTPITASFSVGVHPDRRGDRPDRGARATRSSRRPASQGAAWQRRFAVPLQMFVNVSGQQLDQPALPRGGPGHRKAPRPVDGNLGLEVTESVLIGEAGSSATVLNELDAHGLRLLLDDFGTGYSSLSYLRRFPLGGVKVDRSFIDGLGSKPQDAAIMRAIVEMCRALGLTVVAEGVETDAQLRQLRQLGCGQVQGYLLCHPRPAEEIGEFLD